jgi:hypothetical protein
MSVQLLLAVVGLIGFTLITAAIILDGFDRGTW